MPIRNCASFGFKSVHLSSLGQDANQSFSYNKKRAYNFDPIEIIANTFVKYCRTDLN